MPPETIARAGEGDEAAMRVCDEERFRQGKRTTAGQRPSMGQDMQKGRRTEIEFLNGLVVREGEKVGLTCRANDVLTDTTAHYRAPTELSRGLSAQRGPDFKAEHPVGPHDGPMGRNLRAEMALHCLDLKWKQRIKVTCPHEMIDIKSGSGPNRDFRRRERKGEIPGCR